MCFFGLSKRHFALTPKRLYSTFYAQLPLNGISKQNGCNYFAVTSALNIYIKTMEQGMKVQGRPARDGHI